jgi:hypothetical protein
MCIYKFGLCGRESVLCEVRTDAQGTIQTFCFTRENYNKSDISTFMTEVLYTWRLHAAPKRLC